MPDRRQDLGRPVAFSDSEGRLPKDVGGFGVSAPRLQPKHKRKLKLSRLEFVDPFVYQMRVRKYHRYRVWELGHELALDVYRVTTRFPKSEVYGLTSQLRRSASGVPTNIAEGSGRASPREFARFLDIAAGSANEVEYQLLLARDLAYLDDKAHAKLKSKVNEVRKMLIGLRKHVLA